MKSRKIRHKFNGKTYIVDTEPFQAVCDCPDADRPPCILFPSGIQNTQNSLCNIVHEAIHASNWDTPEDTVHRMGREIGSILWKLGWRLVR